MYLPPYTCPPHLNERVHAPSYTSTCSHAVWPVHTRVLRWRGGEGVARQLQHHRCCCCLQSGIILSAMPGISKRNTSGFAIVLRICSPIHNLPLRPPPPPSHLSSSDTAASSFPPIFFVDPIASLYETRIAIDPRANNAKIESWSKMLVCPRRLLFQF